ncbi:putative 2-oxoglutarate-dependent dioxygenase [Dichanthelium oligosanthes]|uniref:Putative 2-oxoglutarate-dependent dioxygenase n=1 Tax=Dichanthelium oligosanthes TaxID=888268 RepID=A0A1E5UL69_9POAL|nr:putative 2-oxoglutarate-dependent dioxygenase [Dichanthelium oligosanthes]
MDGGRRPTISPENPSNFEALLENYINLCRDLSRKIMRGIALALGGAVDAFERETAGDPFWVLRLIGYPVDIPEEQHTGTGWNTLLDVDFHMWNCRRRLLLIGIGLLTLINQDDDICALEVQNGSGEWIHATAIPGTFVCNIGDMLQLAPSFRSVWSHQKKDPIELPWNQMNSDRQWEGRAGGGLWLARPCANARQHREGLPAGA